MGWLAAGGRAAPRTVSRVEQWGETYNIHCPFCRDRSFRLSVNHSWAFPDAHTRRERLWLAKCFHEDCPAGQPAPAPAPRLRHRALGPRPRPPGDPRRRGHAGRRRAARRLHAAARTPARPPRATLRARPGPRPRPTRQRPRGRPLRVGPAAVDAGDRPARRAARRQRRVRGLAGPAAGRRGSQGPDAQVVDLPRDREARGAVQPRRGPRVPGRCRRRGGRRRLDGRAVRRRPARPHDVRRAGAAARRRLGRRIRRDAARQRRPGPAGRPGA